MCLQKAMQCMFYALLQCTLEMLCTEVHADEYASTISFVLVQLVKNLVMSQVVTCAEEYL